MSWTKQEVQEAVQKVLTKAQEDAEFRKLVLTDVYAAVKEVSGKEVPREFKINIVDGTGYHATFILPEVRKSADELTETDLELVAGGSKFVDFLEDVGNGILDAASEVGNAVYTVGKDTLQTVRDVAINISKNPPDIHIGG